MKTIKIFVFSTCFLFILFSTMLAQGGDQSLTMQGLNHLSNNSASSTAMGGVTMNIKNDISTIFMNPASLQSVNGIQISFGGLQQYNTSDQTQNWVPLKNYTNFSILMDGTVTTLPPVVIDTSKIGPTHSKKQPDAGDTLWRPYDSYGPSWTHKKNQMLPQQATIAIPLTLFKKKVVIGVGISEYSNLNYFYQNNNVLSQDVGLVQQPLNDSASSALPIYWRLHSRKRDGSIMGYGGAVSISLTDQIILGMSTRLLKGSTTDDQAFIGRGTLVFFRDYFRLVPYQYDTLVHGSSDYNGQEYALSGMIVGKNISFGIVVKPPLTITRDYKSTGTVDSAGTVMSTYSLTGTDKMKLPWRGRIGLGMTLDPNFTAGIEYEYIPYSSATYSQGGVSSNPWLDGSSVKFGFEYTPAAWLALRGGYHSQQEVFQATGNPNHNEVVTYDVFSAGAGFKCGSIYLNIAFEYFDRQYEDLWLTNGNINKETQYNIAAEISYSLR